MGPVSGGGYGQDHQSDGHQGPEGFEGGEQVKDQQQHKGLFDDPGVFALGIEEDGVAGAEDQGSQQHGEGEQGYGCDGPDQQHGVVIDSEDGSEQEAFKWHGGACG